MTDDIWLKAKESFQSMMRKIDQAKNRIYQSDNGRIKKPYDTRNSVIRLTRTIITAYDLVLDRNKPLDTERIKS